MSRARVPCPCALALDQDPDLAAGDLLGLVHEVENHLRTSNQLPNIAAPPAGQEQCRSASFSSEIPVGAKTRNRTRCTGSLSARAPQQCLRSSWEDYATFGLAVSVLAVNLEHCGAAG